jgi:hypothetical protein
MATLIREVPRKRRGKAKSRIKDIHQPLMKANDKPETHIAKARRI